MWTTSSLILAAHGVGLKTPAPVVTPGPQLIHLAFVHMIGHVIEVAAYGIGFMNQLPMPIVLNIMARLDYSTLEVEVATSMLMNRVGVMLPLTLPITRRRRPPLPLPRLLRRVMVAALSSRSRIAMLRNRFRMTERPTANILHGSTSMWPLGRFVRVEFALPHGPPSWVRTLVSPSVSAPVVGAAETSGRATGCRSRED